jgi:hypothetical protein
MPTRRWDYLVQGYYNDTVKPPRKPGALALEVGVMGESARDQEVSVFESREDIGRVEILDIRRT